MGMSGRSAAGFRRCATAGAVRPPAGDDELHAALSTRLAAAYRIASCAPWCGRRAGRSGWLRRAAQRPRGASPSAQTGRAEPKRCGQNPICRCPRESALHAAGRARRRANPNGESASVHVPRRMYTKGIY
eukprot:330594-Chlamydomonas_euryale.AAC.12